MSGRGRWQTCGERIYKLTLKRQIYLSSVDHQAPGHWADTSGLQEHEKVNKTLLLLNKKVGSNLKLGNWKLLQRSVILIDQLRRMRGYRKQRELKPYLSEANLNIKSGELIVLNK